MTTIILSVAGGLVLAVGLFFLYVYLVYTKHIVRIFKEMPFLLADKGTPLSDAETISLTTPSGRRLAASWISSPIPARGAILYLHEYGATRWLAGPYVGYLRDDGFDILSIDFCNHGDSEEILGYKPTQWPTHHELEDAHTGLAYLKARLDASTPIGIFGVSKGGGVGIVAAGQDGRIAAVVTDGAFPVSGTVVHYAIKWIEIYSQSRFLHRILPRWFFAFFCWAGLRHVEREKNVRYLSVEQGVRQLAGRLLFMIHGKRDNYIRSEIVQELFDLAPGPKELWMVPGAKHNMALEKEGENYRQRVRAFFMSAMPVPDQESATSVR